MASLRLLQGVLFLVLVAGRLSAQPVLKVELADQPASGVEISLQGDTSHYYVLLGGTVPDSVTEPVAVELGRSDRLRFLQSAPNAPRFYRMGMYALNDPGDQDRDGMDDVFELRHAGLNPLNALDAMGDLDGDGASNLDEYRAHTDPLVSDAAPMLARLASGDRHTLAIAADGSLFAWGNNGFGQVGVGNTLHQFEPVPVGVGESWERVAAGASFSMAITRDGRLFGWGRNSSSQLGDGTTTDLLIPKWIAPARRWKQVACGDSHTLAIDIDGHLWGWGSNLSGELGDGTKTTRSVPVPLVMDRKWTWVAAGKSPFGTGSSYSFAIDEQGQLWGTGKSSGGELGPVQGTALQVWKQAVGPQTWAKAFCRGRQVIALDRNGGAWCWGSAAPLDSVIAAGNPGANTPIQVLPDRRIRWAALGQVHATVLTEDGALFTWGSGDYEVHGIGSATPLRSPVQVPSSSPWTEACAGGLHMVGVRKDGTLWTWGYNVTGELGQGNRSIRLTPGQVGQEDQWAEVVAGSQYILARKEDGTVWGAGNNVLGQLGDGEVSDRSTLTKVGGDRRWKKIAAGLNFAIGTDLEGNHWYWGGDFASPSQSGAIRSPQPILPPATDMKVTAVSSGGTLASMLWFNRVQVLDFTRNPTNLDPVPLALPDVLQPFDFPGTDVWTSVNSGYNHLLALAMDGSLWAYGDNFFGQLGNGTVNNATTLVPVSSDQTWAGVFPGDKSSMALASDGSLWVWGRVMTQDTPTVKYETFTEPKLFSADRPWQFVSKGSEHSLALDTDGGLWAWGENSFAQLGDGTQSPRKDPVRVAESLQWKSVAAGVWVSAGVAMDGTLWTWGDNGRGQLGDDSRSLLPAQIGLGRKWGGTEP